MITVHFTFVGEDGSPSGYYGLASAETKERLFQIIDEFGDPNHAKVRVVKSGSGVCFKLTEYKGTDETEYSETETTDDFPCLAGMIDGGFVSFMKLFPPPKGGYKP